MVINQKMMKVIVSGIPQSVRLGVAMIEDVITFGRSAEHAGGLSGHHPNFLDFPGGVAFGGECTGPSTGFLLQSVKKTWCNVHVRVVRVVVLPPFFCPSC